MGQLLIILRFGIIRLFQQLSMQSEEAGPVAFVELASADSRSADASANALGLSVKTLSVFDQKFYHLPQGVYITAVAPGSTAEMQGIVTGDILISIENTAIPDADTLNDLLSSCYQKQPLRAVIFRGGKLYRVTLTAGGGQ